MKQNVKYWLDLSDYDLDTAIAMLESKRYLYVGFMCHQCIEKIFKGYYSNFNENPPPYTHSLAYLAEKSGLVGKINEGFIELINALEPMNIEARYPSYKEKLLKGLSEEKCKYLISKTKELQTWVKMKF